jgi:hypothetical protein
MLWSVKMLGTTSSLIKRSGTSDRPKGGRRQDGVRRCARCGLGDAASPPSRLLADTSTQYDGRD